MFIPISAIIGMNIISGAMNTLVASGMNKLNSSPGQGENPSAFNHPFVQTLIMMFGEASCLIIFALRYYSKRGSIESPWKRAQLLFAIPCCLDWCTTSMMYASMLDLPGSVVQMLRGSLVIFVFFISVFFLRNRQYAHHFVGVIIVVVGITLVGLSAVMSPTPLPVACVGSADGQGTCEKGYNCMRNNAIALQGVSGSCKSAQADKHEANVGRGLVLCVLSQIVAAVLMTSEEKIFKKMQTPAIMAIGIEGSCGIIIGMVVLFVTYLIGVEKPGEAAVQISNSGPLAATCIALCFSIAFFNTTGVTITKEISATARSTIDGLRTLFVWFGDLSMGWATNDDPALLCFWLQPLGFGVTMLGTLIYFNTIPIPALMGPDELEEYNRKKEEQAALAEGQQAFLGRELQENNEPVPNKIMNTQAPEEERELEKL